MDFDVIILYSREIQWKSGKYEEDVIALQMYTLFFIPQMVLTYFSIF